MTATTHIPTLLEPADPARCSTPSRHVTASTFLIGGGLSGAYVTHL